MCCSASATVSSAPAAPTIVFTHNTGGEEGNATQDMSIDGTRQHQAACGVPGRPPVFSQWRRVKKMSLIRAKRICV
jgi:hypothetical protein